MRFVSSITTHSRSDRLHAHRHAAAYIAMVLEGEYMEFSADGAWSCQPGDLVVHPPFHYHANAFRRQTRVMNLGVPDGLVCEKELEAYKVVRADGFSGDAGMALDTSALSRLLRDSQSARSPVVDDWVDCLAMDLAGSCGAPIFELARAYSVSPEHVSRRFRQRYQMTPSMARMERRFRKALQLLRTPTHSLGDIALLAGYADQAHFSRHCRQITGLSPGQLRRPVA